MNIRFAKSNEIKKIHCLIEVSAKHLQVGFYKPKTIVEGLELVSGINQMVNEGTFFVAEAAGDIVACGGYSNKGIEKKAELRAFFVHPENSRKGLASAILERCIDELEKSGVNELSLAATLVGEPFYRKHGFDDLSRESIILSSGSSFEVVNMYRVLTKS